MPDLRTPAARPRWWPHFSSTLRSTAVTARLGRVLGIAIAICFVTGLMSELQYHPLTWLPWPATPVWIYRLTQGVHVLTGTACLPLVLVKLDHRINKLALPWARTNEHRSERFAAWGERLWKRPLAYGLAALVVLLALAAPVVGLQTAMPSITHRGMIWFGDQVLPTMWFTITGRPDIVSRWRMWVYSCATRPYSQSSWSSSSPKLVGPVA